MPILSIRNIHKQFEDGVDVLRGIDLDVEEGEIVCLLGPSGCGKTTLLRVIAGLETPDRGKIALGGQDISPIPVHRRGIGLMFQDYALFPHKDVAANVAFGLRMQKLSPPQIEQRVHEALALVNLLELAHRDVNRLSGGEQQRVALARALAPRPRLLMLDEPIGALDRTLRDRLLEELRRILKQVGVTVIYVTHDQVEAFAIADRVALINAGQVVQTGTPQEVYRRPSNTWAARFLGMRNLLPGEWIAPGLVQTEIGALAVDGCGQGPLTVLVRPEAAARARATDSSIVEGTIVSRSFRGPTVHLVVRYASGIQLAFEMPAAEDLPVADQEIALALQPSGIVCLDN